MGLRRDPETGLYQVRNRYYHPTLGRFLSRDPVNALRATEHYAYAAGDPIDMGDPTGTWPKFLDNAWAAAKELPGAIASTFMDGSAADSLSGMVKGMTGIPTKPINGHGAAFEGGVGIGKATRSTAMSVLPVGKWGGAAISAVTAYLETGGDLDAALEATLDSLTPDGLEVLLKSAKVGLKAGKQFKAALDSRAKGKALAGGSGAIKPKAGDSGQSAAKQYAEKGGHCFVAGTLVVTDRGLKRIEEVLPQDHVLAKDDETGVVEYKPVVRTMVSESKDLFHIRYHVRESNGPPAQVQEITATRGHLFWSKSRELWVPIEALQVGEFLSAIEGNAVVASVTPRTADAASGTKTFNFEVEGFHTYFVVSSSAAAREAGILVHNEGCDEKLPTQRGRETEKRVLADEGYIGKNTNKVYNSKGDASIPDAITPDEIVEIKDVKYQADTKQLRIQRDAAEAAGKKHVLLVRPGATISRPLRESGTEIREFKK